MPSEVTPYEVHTSFMQYPHQRCFTQTLSFQEVQETEQKVKLHQEEAIRQIQNVGQPVRQLPNLFRNSMLWLGGARWGEREWIFVLERIKNSKMQCLNIIRS